MYMKMDLKANITKKYKKIIAICNDGLMKAIKKQNKLELHRKTTPLNSKCMRYVFCNQPYWMKQNSNSSNILELQLVVGLTIFWELKEIKADRHTLALG